MYKLLTLLLVLSLAPAHRQTPPNQSSPHNYEFINGRWFDGKVFTSGAFYSVGGILTSRKPARVDSVFDLKGGYVVPPFGEAHNHNVEGSSVDAVIRKYLEAGIFYVKNPNSLPRTTQPVLTKVNTPTSIDVIFARGGLTGGGGHPLGLVKRNIDRGNWTEADGEGAFYFAINNLSDLDHKWETIKSGKPDFIKTYLLFSEDYEKRKDDPAYFGSRGLNPTLLPEIVRRAHKSKMSVSTHIETAADFRNAVSAGVDEINHMVGYSPDQKLLKSEGLSRYQITEDDARVAAQKGVVVITTLGGAIEAVRQIDESTPDASLRKEFKNLLISNLQRLKKHNVRLAIGSDHYRQTAAYEAARLHELGVFDNLTLLKIWCEATAATIFPNRKIGHLRDGFEASFLVLAGSPVEDFLNTSKIVMRVKQGEILTLQREVAITFDDLPGVQMGGTGCGFRALEALNRKLIDGIVSNRIPALGLVVESRLCEDKTGTMARLLKMWLDAGLELGNHSYSHFDLNRTPLEKYKSDVIRGEAVTKKLLEDRGLKLKYFRHPYLHAGKDIETKRLFDRFLGERGYQLAPVTIDNQEWVFAEVYARALRRRDSATAQRVGAAYITYMEQMFDFFERLSIQVTGYEIKQVLLLHDNVLNADYLDKLVQMTRKRGYSFITLAKALEDPAYRLPDTYAGAEGLSWLHRWAITKGMTLKKEPREPLWITRLMETR